MDKPALGIMPDTIFGSAIEQSHIIDLPPLCPVSRNPQKGSTLTIKYTATDKSLEVYSLTTYIQSYVGGKYWRGEYFIRDMEQTIRAIKVDCEEVLDTEVEVIADLLLDTHRVQIRTQ